MVSLWSFFSGKRKSKTRPRTPSPPQGAKTSVSTSLARRPSSPVKANRFLSLRSKSRSRLYDTEQRRSSSEAVGAKRPSVISAQGDAPRLELGWEQSAGEEVFKDVTARPVLSVAEVQVLEQQQWSCEEVGEAWKVFGKVFRETGVSTPGIFINPSSGSVELQNYLLALFILSLNPPRLPSFPSITPHIPPDSASAQIRDRLTAQLSSASPIDLAEILKWSLKHLSPPPKGILPDEAYERYKAAEREHDFDPGVYASNLLPSLTSGVASYLDEVFDILGAVVIHSDENGLTSERICHLLGHWILGGQLGSSDKWEVLYSTWEDAGRKVEHLFYAWIRYGLIFYKGESLMSRLRAEAEKLPTRLLAVAEDYSARYGSASEAESRGSSGAGSKVQALHLQMTSAESLRTPLSSGALRAALQLRSDHGEMPEWTQLLFDGDRQRTFDEIVSSCAAESRQTDLVATPVNGAPPKSLVYRMPSGRTHTRKRSQSHGDIDHLTRGSHINRLDSLTEELSLLPHARPDLIQKRSATNMVKSSSTFSTWDDFTKSGFSEEAVSSRLDLSLPTTSSNPILVKPVLPRAASDDAASKDATHTAIAQKTARYSLRAVSESSEVIDDTFVAYYEDLQRSPAVSSPAFTILRLNPALHSTYTYLILSVTYQPPPPPLVPDIPTIRPISPSGRSTTSRMSSVFSFRDFTSSFRRSSSYGQKQPSSHNLANRRSVFGTTTKPLERSSTAGGGLATLAEDRPPPSAFSTAPTEYTIGELGEVVKIDARPETGADSASGSVTNAQGAVLAGVASLSKQTPWQDWIYTAEGAAHAVFAYTGLEPSYVGKVIRIQKVSEPEESEYTRTRESWSNELLPRIVPRDLLVLSKRIDLDDDWLKALLESAEEHRPRKRKESGALKHRVTQVQLMENLLHVGSTEEGETSVVIEIKPKWGFLPLAENIQPPEAADIKCKHCRYCLHQHFRGVQVAEGEVKYCPLDLYSERNEVVRRAIAGLWDSWRRTGGEGNNWRLYIDGKAIKPDSNSNIVKNLEHSDAFTQHLIDSFRARGVFELLRRLQMAFDPIDLSGIIDQAGGDASFADVDTSEPTAGELRSILDDVTGGKGEGAKPGWSVRQRIVAYALSAVFKDCSVFFKTAIHLDTSGDVLTVVKPTTSIRVIDLDLKPVGRIRQWAALDEEIWRHWAAEPPRAAGVAPRIKEEPTTPQPGISAINQFETPIRPRAVTNLSHLTHLSTATNDVASERDNASTRAMFVHTPGVSRPDTPLGSPFAAAPSEEHAEEELVDRARIAGMGEGEGVTLEDALAISPPQAPAPRSRVSLDVSPEEKAPVAGGSRQQASDTKEETNEEDVGVIEPAFEGIDEYEEALRPTSTPQVTSNSQIAEPPMMFALAPPLAHDSVTGSEALESPVEERRERSLAPSPASELVELPPQSDPLPSTHLDPTANSLLPPTTQLIPEPTPSLISDHGSVASSPTASQHILPIMQPDRATLESASQPISSPLDTSPIHPPTSRPNVDSELLEASAPPMMDAPPAPPASNAEATDGLAARPTPPLPLPTEHFDANAVVRTAFGDALTDPEGSAMAQENAMDAERAKHTPIASESSRPREAAEYRNHIDPPLEPPESIDNHSRFNGVQLGAANTPSQESALPVAPQYYEETAIALMQAVAPVPVSNGNEVSAHANDGHEVPGTANLPFLSEIQAESETSSSTAQNPVLSIPLKLTND